MGCLEMLSCDVDTGGPTLLSRRREAAPIREVVHAFAQFVTASACLIVLATARSRSLRESFRPLKSGV